MSQRLAIILVFIGAGCYGLHATISKIGYAHGLDTGQITGIQFIVGAISLWGLAAWKGRKWQRPSRKAALKLMTAGTLAGLTSLLYIASIQTLPASIATVLLFQFVWIGVFYEWLFQRIKPDGQILLAIALTIVGALCAADVFHDQFKELSIMGILLGLGSAFSCAGTLYVSGKVETGVSPWLRSPLMLTGALILVMVIYPPSFIVTGVPWNSFWLLGIVLGLVGTAVPTLCLAFGAPRISATLTSMLSSLQLPIAIVMAWSVLSEPISALQWVGVGWILAGITVKGARFPR